ncbi:hypothetical protein N2603_42840 [Bradyrhizobium huanghuaihaiense]|uniref:hypothetical protein n=1 Tax=Bradyrhizobium huanghuaihaiense TaxID=990078 RepID=UPI0021AA4CF0|nr:hypothetical protein [Bradyrhizobium sp. CB3035]UWU76528.1 hypothetical protein N2603_42840 [Bradyrhizobium sp. CB3035]
MLGLEDVEYVAASAETGQDETAPQGRTELVRKRRSTAGGLPRIEVMVDIDDRTCLWGKGDLHGIGEDRSEGLAWCRPSSAVVVTRRPKCLPRRRRWRL